MTSRTCEEYRGQENGKEDRQADEVRRRKKNFQREVVEENAPEENGISNRLFSSTFIPPLTSCDRFAMNAVNPVIAAPATDAKNNPPKTPSAMLSGLLGRKGLKPGTPVLTISTLLNGLYSR